MVFLFALQVNVVSQTDNEYFHKLKLIIYTNTLDADNEFNEMEFQVYRELFFIFLSQLYRIRFTSAFQIIKMDELSLVTWK